MLKDEFDGPKNESSLDYLSGNIMNKVSFSRSNSNVIGEETFKPNKKGSFLFIFYLY